MECNVVPCKIEDRPFVFISYAHSDAHFVSLVLEGVAANGYHIWYDKGIEISTTWSDEIANAIVASEIFVVFVTKASMASGYVRSEIEFAISKKIPVVPVYMEGLGVLPPGLALALHSTQGIDSKDPKVIISRLCKWLMQNVKEENWQPIKSSMPAVLKKDVPVPVVAKIPQTGQENPADSEEDNYWQSGQHGNKEEYERYLIIKESLAGDAPAGKFGIFRKNKTKSGVRTTGSVHAVSSRPYLAKLLALIFLVNFTEIFRAYQQWRFERPFLDALLVWGLPSVVFYWYFFRRYTVKESLLGRLLPKPGAVNSLLYWAFLAGWLLSTLDLNNFKIWIPFIAKGLDVLHVRLDFSAISSMQFPLIPQVAVSLGSFAATIGGAALIFDGVISGIMSFFAEKA